MDVHKVIFIESVQKAAKEAAVTGVLDLRKAYLYRVIYDHVRFATFFPFYNTERQFLGELMDNLKNQYPEEICRIKTKIPQQLKHIEIGTAESDDYTQNVDINNVYVTDIEELPLLDGTRYATYKFNVDDFLKEYTDTNDQQFYSIVLYRGDLDGTMFKRNNTPTTQELFGEDSFAIEIPVTEFDKWSWYATDEGPNQHEILFKVIDRYAGNDFASPIRLLIMDKTGVSLGNKPPTGGIGDNTITVPSRSATVITLAMVTTDLKPPYNDPEGDLIDAIRIIEISEANKGKFELDGIELVGFEIITKEMIQAGLLIFYAPDQSEQWADSFRIEARDEGSGIWVE